MTAKDTVLNIMRAQGRADALVLRSRAGQMDGTALIREEDKIPAFDPSKDYTSWPIGAPVTDGGQVWTLLQPYNAAYYPQRPVELRSLWGLAHTRDPARAKPWVAPLGTSGVYSAGECCTDPESEDPAAVWRSRVDNNAFSPSQYEANWEKVEVD